MKLTFYKGNVLEENHYYPFGLTLTSATNNSAEKNNYKYNGHELNEELGLNWYSYGDREYDPQIGRFASIDPFASKFAFASPYHYAKNNPVINIDINGDSTWTTTNTVNNADGTTTTTNTTHITGKVLDLAGVERGGGCNSRPAAGELAAGINDEFNGQHIESENNGNKEIWNFDVQFSVAKSMDDVSPSDHLLVVVDDVLGKADASLGGGNAGGLADPTYAGKVAYVENTSNFNFLVQNSVHEIGHNMGEHHVENGSYNFMSYDQIRTNFTSLQIMQMYNRSHNGALNKGENSQHSIINTNNWFYNTSTNEAPWYKNTSVGERIPKILKNNP